MMTMIDLRSDTVTKPTDSMRELAAQATVGDDVYGEDQTVNELETSAAELLGFEDALYVPSGTMGNQIAARTHTESGQEIICERDSHIYRWELGGLAQHSGLQTRPIDGTERGVLKPSAIADGIVEEDAHRPGTGLLALENTHNAAGGTAIAPSRIDEGAATAHEHGVPVHLDGARLANAAVAHDVAIDRFTEAVDSALLCLSKGLGAPVGSVLAGSASFIEQARRARKLLGGGMRQAGIIAAPGLAALESIDRLETDHENAALLAERLDSVEGLTVHPPETNILLVTVSEPAEAFLDACADVDVLATAFDTHLVRFTTHRDVSRAAVETAADRIVDVVSD